MSSKPGTSTLPFSVAAVDVSFAGNTVPWWVPLVGLVLLGTVAAYAFSRFQFKGRTQLMLGYLVVRMFPAVLMIIPLFIVMRNLGLFDTSLGLAVAYTSFLLPLFVWML